jgi:Gas vesicle synthesis protein GvpL/GvpF
MKRLVYCIFDGKSGTAAAAPGTFHIGASNGLVAVVACESAPDSPPDTGSLLAFAGVVQAMHVSHDVIPLRYGCVMASEESVVRLLEENGQAYAALLDGLNGMSEMGVRLLCQSADLAPTVSSLSPGAGYLASLRARHGSIGKRHGSLPVLEHVEAADRITALLAESFTAQRREYAPAAGNSTLVSLYFLVPRAGTCRFMKKAREFSLSGTKILVSGPWPPYNFATFNA